MTIYLFKAFADVFMMLPLTLWTGDGRSFMATVLLYAISNGVEFYDLCYKKEATEYKFVKYLVFATVVLVAVLALLACGCMMNYLNIGFPSSDVKKVTSNIVIMTPKNSFLHIPNIKYSLLVNICAFPIATHFLVFLSKYLHDKNKSINNDVVK